MNYGTVPFSRLGGALFPSRELGGAEKKEQSVNAFKIHPRPLVKGMKRF